MTDIPSSNWRDLFSGSPGDASVAFRILKKRGEDFLVLPVNARNAARALSLYPAQTAPARLARELFHFALRCGCSLPVERASVKINAASPFEAFIKRLAGSDSFPALAILCGNPRTPGRRFVLLVFGSDNSPVCVIKAGIGSAAAELIRKETAFLKAIPSGTPAIPSLRDGLDIGNIRCLALDFVEGVSPSGVWSPAPLLTAWLGKNPPVPIESFPAWRQLTSVCASHPVFAKLAPRFAGKQFRAAIQHGDFVPWNIKLSRDGSPVVLDWERGETCGIPAWDWFHYLIQTGILVRHFTTDQLAARVDDLLSSPAFKEYAKLAGIEAFASDLLLASLLYCVEILKPADSLAATRALLEALRTRVPHPVL